MNLSWESLLLLKVEEHAGLHPHVGIQPSPPSSGMDHNVHRTAALNALSALAAGCFRARGTSLGF